MDNLGTRVSTDLSETAADGQASHGFFLSVLGTNVRQTNMRDLAVGLPDSVRD